MLVLNNSYELATTYLQVFLPWMFWSELVVSFACVYFVVTGHFIPVWGLSILRANLASTDKSVAGKVTLPRWSRVVRSYSCKGTVYPGKGPKKSQRAKRIFWGQQVLFGTNFLKFGPKNANLATLAPMLGKVSDFSSCNRTFFSGCEVRA